MVCYDYLIGCGICNIILIDLIASACESECFIKPRTHCRLLIDLQLINPVRIECGAHLSSEFVGQAKYHWFVAGSLKPLLMFSLIGGLY